MTASPPAVRPGRRHTTHRVLLACRLAALALFTTTPPGAMPDDEPVG